MAYNEAKSVVMSLLEKSQKSKLDKLVDDGPENKLLRYFVYYPLIFIAGLIVLFILAPIAAEIGGWIFGIGLIICIVAWPIIKVYEFITRNR